MTNDLDELLTSIKERIKHFDSIIPYEPDPDVTRSDLLELKQKFQSLMIIGLNKDEEGEPNNETDASTA